MTRRVKVQWTRPARDALAKLPHKIRRAMLDKTAALAHCDPSTAHKRLRGALGEFHSIRVSRYRALYRVDEETLANGDVLIFVRVVVVAVGMRKEGDRRDIYRLAERLIRFADLGTGDADEGGDDI